MINKYSKKNKEKLAKGTKIFVKKKKKKKRQYHCDRTL